MMRLGGIFRLTLLRNRCCFFAALSLGGAFTGIGALVVAGSRHLGSDARFLTPWGKEPEPVWPMAVGEVEGNVSDSLRALDRPPFGPIALLFLIQDHVVQRSYWTAWIDDARTWAKETFDAELSDVVVFYVHPDMRHTRRSDPHLPHILEPYVIENPSTCKWGFTTACMLRLLAAAVDGRPSEPVASWFIYVSGSTIPLKPLKWIYSSLYANPRSRFAFSNVNMKPVKHHQWVVLSRAHAHVLVANGKMWVRHSAVAEHLYPSGRQVYAADDETSIFRTLSAILGRDEAMTGINDGEPLPPFEDTHPAGYKQAVFQTTWVCWTPRCLETVGRPLPDEYPGFFVSVNESGFLNEVWNTPFWFARKFASTARLEPPSVEDGKNFTKLLLRLFSTSTFDWDRQRV
eukprot:Polyplicarium_translucidae@DN3398_c3_g1_i4.p1